MLMRRVVITGVLILIVCGILVSTAAMGVTIIIDGDFSDWNGLEPVFTEEEVHTDYWLDIQQAFVVANETMLFIRVDYAAPLDYWAAFTTNITLQTPSNEVFVLMFFIEYDSIPQRSTTWIFPGINLSTFLNAKSNLTELASYQNSAAISPSNTSVEYYYPLSDLGLTLNDTIDVTFWHYEDVSAGEYSVLLHRFAGTVYKVLLNGTGSSYQPTSTTTVTTPITTNIASIAILGTIIGVAAITIKKRKNKY